jgi:hypothetical protein
MEIGKIAEEAGGLAFRRGGEGGAVTWRGTECWSAGVLE